MDNPLMIIGQGALMGDKGEDYLNLCIELAHEYNFLKDEWNGFNVLHTAASRPGAMEIGFLPGEKGKNLDQIIKSYKTGDISTLFLLGADEIDISEKFFFNSKADFLILSITNDGMLLFIFRAC